jgi:AraC-like DNA-binding protein
MPFRNNITSSGNEAIEETRQSSKAAQKEPEAFGPTVGPPRGVLQPATPHGGGFFHQRLAPPAPLAQLIQHYWFVQWDLRGAGPRFQETLPHPSCYLLFEHDLEQPAPDDLTAKNAEVSGVCTGKFSRQLEGWGRVFGVKFRPGGLRPFLDDSVSTLTDRVVPAERVFGQPILTLASAVRRMESAEEMAEASSAFFMARLPAPDSSSTLSGELVDAILNDPSILSVEDLASRRGIGVRSLQRLFKDYVGVSPKWVIRRYRLHELVARFHSGHAFDGAQVALDLGYADQAHLINDFRNLAGYTPSEYRKRALAANQDGMRSGEVKVD